MRRPHFGASSCQRRKAYSAAMAFESTQAARPAGLPASAGGSTAAATRASGPTRSSTAAPSTRRVRRGHALLDRISGAAPQVRLYVPSGLYDPSFVSGLTPAAQTSLERFHTGLSARDQPAGGKPFVSPFTRLRPRPAPRPCSASRRCPPCSPSCSQAGTKANSARRGRTDFRSLKIRRTPRSAATRSAAAIPASRRS